MSEFNPTQSKNSPANEASNALAFLRCSSHPNHSATAKSTNTTAINSQQILPFLITVCQLVVLRSMKFGKTSSGFESVFLRSKTNISHGFWWCLGSMNERHNWWQHFLFYVNRWLDFYIESTKVYLVRKITWNWENPDIWPLFLSASSFSILPRQKKGGQLVSCKILYKLSYLIASNKSLICRNGPEQAYFWPFHHQHRINNVHAHILNGLNYKALQTGNKTIQTWTELHFHFQQTV